MAAPMRSSLAPTELVLRLGMIGMNQTRFAKRAGISRQRVNCYCHGVPMPASVERALQLEELTFALRALVQAPYERVPKTKLRILVAAAEPSRLTQIPRRKRRGKRRRTNWLSPKYLPQPVAADVVDEPKTWALLAERIGADAARQLHASLASQRPAQPRHSPGDDDEPPKVRIARPI